MQCGCPQCGVLMANVVKGLESECKCPECGHECKACLGLMRGAGAPLQKGMSKEQWELMLRLRNRDVDD